MMDAAETLGKDVSLQSACQALGVSRATLYRRRCRGTEDRQSPRSSSPRALSQAEQQEVRSQLNSDRFIDQAPREIYASLLDEGQYLCSVRTMYRLLSADSASKERRNQLRHPNYLKPELLATGPNQVWSWDITKLLGPQKWLHYHLYVILDIYSRYVVGWTLAHRESASLASRMIRQTVEKQGICEDQLTIHSDRGPSMSSQSVAQLLATLGVVKSHSRPYVSNDNPFSESQFKTMKYRPEFPGRFGSFEDALSYCRSFFEWYNDEHYHSGIGHLTPAMLHYGKADQVFAERAQVLQEAYTLHPERFVRGCPKRQIKPAAVWINPPRVTDEADHNGKPPLIEIQTPSEPIDAKTELETSPLTSAKATNLLEVPGQNTPSLNKADQEKRLPETIDLRKPEAPLTHPRPGYPLASCVPAELASVSPDAVKLNGSTVHLQPPLNTRVMPEKIPGVWGLAPDEIPREETTMKTLH